MKIAKLTPFADDRKTMSAVIATPRGGCNRFGYDDDLDAFQLVEVLPAGRSFAFDFALIPQTVGTDGEALDLLVLMDAPAFTGCVVETRLIGIIEAEQTVEGETTRNDRLIAVAVPSQLYRDVQSLDDLSEALVDGIVNFFISYHEIHRRIFMPIGRYGTKRAHAAVQAAMEHHRKRRSR